MVRHALDRGAAMSTVNWAEVLSKSVDFGRDPDELRLKLLQKGVLENSLLLLPLTEEMAFEIARLRARTRTSGLSLGDRACLALGRHLHLPILTADRNWKALKLGANVQLIR